jgi:hypothetical protein
MSNYPHPSPIVHPHRLEWTDDGQVFNPFDPAYDLLNDNGPVSADGEVPNTNDNAPTSVFNRGLDYEAECALEDQLFAELVGDSW